MLIDFAPRRGGRQTPSQLVRSTPRKKRRASTTAASTTPVCRRRRSHAACHARRRHAGVAWPRPRRLPTGWAASQVRDAHRPDPPTCRATPEQQLQKATITETAARRIEEAIVGPPPEQRKAMEAASKCRRPRREDEHAPSRAKAAGRHPTTRRAGRNDEAVRKETGVPGRSEARVARRSASFCSSAPTSTSTRRSRRRTDARRSRTPPTRRSRRSGRCASAPARRLRRRRAPRCRRG